MNYLMDHERDRKIKAAFDTAENAHIKIGCFTVLQLFLFAWVFATLDIIEPGAILAAIKEMFAFITGG